MDKIELDFPSYLDVSFQDDDHRVVNATLAFDPTSGRYLTQSLTIAHPFATVTASVLRALKLRSRLAAAIREQLAIANPDAVSRRALKTYIKGTEGRPVAAAKQLHPSDEQIAEAGAVMELAIAAGDFPIRSVQRVFGLEEGMHRRWASIARATGMCAR